MLERLNIQYNGTLHKSKSLLPFNLVTLEVRNQADGREKPKYLQGFKGTGLESRVRALSCCFHFSYVFSASGLSDITRTGEEIS